jgi:hypothetical protein
MDGSLLNLLLSGAASVVFAADSRPGQAPADPQHRLEPLIQMHRAAASGTALLPVAAPRATPDRPAPRLCTAPAER